MWYDRCRVRRLPASWRGGPAGPIRGISGEKISDETQARRHSLSGRSDPRGVQRRRAVRPAGRNRGPEGAFRPARGRRQRTERHLRRGDVRPAGVVWPASEGPREAQGGARRVAGFLAEGLARGQCRPVVPQCRAEGGRDRRQHHLAQGPVRCGRPAGGYRPERDDVLAAALAVPALPQHPHAAQPLSAAGHPGSPGGLRAPCRHGLARRLDEGPGARAAGAGDGVGARGRCPDRAARAAFAVCHHGSHRRRAPAPAGGWPTPASAASPRPPKRAGPHRPVLPPPGARPDPAAAGPQPQPPQRSRRPRYPQG